VLVFYRGMIDERYSRCFNRKENHAFPLQWHFGSDPYQNGQVTITFRSILVEQCNFDGAGNRRRRWTLQEGNNSSNIRDLPRLL
jgi:hypothetical protein